MLDYPCNSGENFISVQFSHSVLSDSLPAHGLQHAWLPCLSSTPRTYSNSCPSHRWCHPTISPSVIPFSHLQSFQASGVLPVTQFFSSGGQSIGVSASASILPMNSQEWFRLGLTGWISLLSKGLSRVFSNTIVQKHQFFGAQLLISWLQSPSAVILEPKNNKSVTVSIVSLSICHEVMGPDVTILFFWMLSFNPTFLRLQEGGNVWFLD